MNQAVWDLKSQFDQYKDSKVFDCRLAEFLLVEGRAVGTEEETFKKYDVSLLEKLAEIQHSRLEAFPKLKSLFYEIEMPLIAVLWRMEQKGILLDVSCLQAVGEELESAIGALNKEIQKEVGFEINLNSSVQVGNFLAEKIMVPLSKTKTGRYATNEQELAKFSDQFPIIEKLLTYRELSKLRSTYVESLISKGDEDHRIHTTYSQTAVNTGRLSSSNPNMQNIPVTSSFGIKIKSCFIAPMGRVLVSFDYSQQELRILAHLTKEETLIKAFNEGRDVHKITASQLFKTDYEKVTKQQRSAAKTVNFGIIYGMSSYGLSQGLRIPGEEAKVFIDRFYATYPKIKTYYDSYLLEGQKNGFVETLLGRRRYVFEYPQQKFIDNNMRRVLINYPIQGSAADLMKKAMVQINKEIVDKDPAVNLLLQIHDDLVFEVDDDEEKMKKFISHVSEIMCQVYPLSVPIEVDIKIGEKWGEMERI